MLPGDAAALGLVVEPQGSSFDSHRIRGREGPFGTHGWKETLTPGRSAGRFLAAPFPINPDGEELWPSRRRMPRSPPRAAGVPPARFGGGGNQLVPTRFSTSVRSPLVGRVGRSRKHPGQDMSTTLTRHQRISFTSGLSQGRCHPCSELALNTQHWGQEHPRCPPSPPCAPGPSCRRKRDSSSENCFIFPLNERNAEKREKKKNLKAGKRNFSTGLK